MCFMLMLAVFRDQSKKQDGKYSLTGIETAVYARMALYASEDGSNIYPGLNTLVAELKFCKTTIQLAIKSLLEKKRIILVQRGSSSFHKSNEYKLNLGLLSKQITIKAPAYSGTVDNFVDNLCTTSPPMVPDTTPPMVPDTTPPMVPDTTHNHIIKSYDKNHMIRGQQIDIQDDLLTMNINKKSVTKWVNEFGFTALTEIIIAMREREKKKGVQIKNKGAYLRKILEQQKSKH